MTNHKNQAALAAYCRTISFYVIKGTPALPIISLHNFGVDGGKIPLRTAGSGSTPYKIVELGVGPLNFIIFLN
jgi:hypothetical protein